MKTAVITGSASGLGQALCRQLAKEGWSLVLVNRNAQKGERQKVELQQEFPAALLETHSADLSDQDDVLAVCRVISSRHHALDALFLNAGALLPSLVYSKQGNEMHLEVNAVAPFLMLHALAEPLARSAASVVVSGSSIRRMVPRLPVDELRSPRKFVAMTGSYAWSKQAVTQAFSAVTDEFAEKKISVTVVDLGPIQTPMSDGPVLPGWMKLFRRFFATPERAAMKLVAALGKSSPATPAAPGLVELLKANPGFEKLR